MCLSGYFIPTFFLANLISDIVTSVRVCGTALDFKNMDWTPETRASCRIVATPIGNLEDLSPRAKAALGEATLIFAEDTRTAKALFNYLKISKPLKSYHKDNERDAAKAAISALKNGERIALISEAGLPGISDPGYILIKALLEERIPFEVIPGPSASVTAASASGLCAEGRFFFYGFLPTKGLEEELKKLTALPYPIIFYESGRRVAATCELLLKYFEPPLALLKEISKFYERAVWIYDAKEIKELSARGEFCVVAKGKGLGAEKEELNFTGISEFLKSKGLSQKDTAQLFKMLGVKRNEAYKLGLNA